MPQSRMRLFYGFDFDSPFTQALVRWRQCNVAPLGRAVPAVNLHTTLLFLGQCEPHQLAGLLEMSDQLDSPAFTIRYQQFGIWPKPGIAFVAPLSIDAALQALVARLKQQAQRLELAVDKRPYRPHITLLRGVRETLAAPLQPLDLSWHCSRFCLYQSLQHDGGVRYQPLACWPLSPQKPH